MTIIKSTSYLSNYPWMAIEEDVLDLIMQCSAEANLHTQAVTLQKALDCISHLMGKRISYLMLSSSEFEEIVRTLIGAFYSEKFISGTSASQQRYVSMLLRTLKIMRNKIPSITYVDDLKKECDCKVALIEKWNQESRSFTKDRIKFWSGWAIESRKGKSHYLELHHMCLGYETDFVIEIHNALKGFFLKQARPSFKEINYLSRYLSENYTKYPEETFRDPIGISDLMKDFFQWYFLDCYKKELNLPSQIKSWNRFVSNMEEAFLDTGIWSRPFVGGFPRPSESSVKGGERRIKTTKEGIEVKDKLLTLVPLQVTDEEAVRIIFKEISEDIGLVRRWARKETYALSCSVKRRELFSKKGTPLVKGALGDFENLSQEDLCATFEKVGFVTGTERKKTYGWGSKTSDLVPLFGLPTSNSLLPFMVLLVLEHPEITSTFLAELSLYDKNGHLSGFVKHDSYYQLTGYKDRKKKSNSQQKIKLTSTSAVYIKQLIKITQPLRDYLKKIGDSNWRKLFLTCGQGFSKPLSGVIPLFGKHNLNNKPAVRERLLSSFSSISNRSRDELMEFIYRVNLSSVRASRGVEIYLENKSVQEMAKALGHTKYDSNLLSHYLPEPILAFFQTRWIRVFQKALICEAMKDSPYLLEATSFESMDDLHSFLSNHAIKDIPSHLSDPENTDLKESGSDDGSHIMVSVDTGILSALLSLEQAVNSSSQRSELCPRALYWSDVSLFISKEIESGQDPLLKKHLEQAKEHIYADKMKEYIYAAS